METMLYNKSILEADITKVNSTDVSSGSASSTGSNQIVDKGNEGVEKAKNYSDEQSTEKNKNGATDAEKKKVDTEVEKTRQFTNKAAATYSTLYQVKYQIAEEMVSGYMKIIKAHVSAYIKVGTKKEGES